MHYIRLNTAGAMPAYPTGNHLPSSASRLADKSEDSDDQSETSSSGDESPSSITRYAHQDELMVETDSSEESGVTFNLPPAILDQTSRASSLSATPTTQSISINSQTPKISEQAKSTTGRGTKTIGRLTSIRPSQLRYPKSQYCNYVPPLPTCHEKYAVADLLGELDRQNIAQGKSGRAASLGQDFVEFNLSEFVMYLPDNRHHPYEIWSLQDLASKNSFNTFLFDGILRVGDVQRYVQAVPFDLCSIGNYGDDMHEVGDNIWIKSTFSAKSSVYYRLKSPAPEYARFYHGFLWLANLAKHFVDYCQWSVNKRRKVSVFDFRTHFAQWTQKRHGMSSSFLSWYHKYQSDDFRHAVAANIHFLFKESIGIDDSLRKQPIWNELLEKNIVPVQDLKESKTIVTPYVYDCFEHLRFGHLLKSVRPTVPQQVLSTSKASQPLERPSFTNESSSVQSSNEDQHAERERKIKAVQVGDVISVTKDGKDSVWKDEATRWKDADDCWYIYVQAVYESKKGKRSFAGLWLYKSSDTCCAKMKYPFPNELFLSDNCTCSRGRIQEDEVLDRVAVEWFGSPSASQQRLFVRQTYLENDKFETLKEGHKTCQHLRSNEGSIALNQKFPVGQTVLVRPPQQKPKYTLEPYEIIAYIEEESITQVALKRLLRRSEIPGQRDRRPNELVYSDRICKVATSKIECACLVRFYSEEDAAGHSIPAPYDRDGTGNAFYITTRLVESGGVQKLEPIHNNIPQTLIQGFDPTKPPPRKLLRSLDLYCGGGNFGRGLEEGGALHNEWAVDYAKVPMHSYYANLKEPSSTKLFCGSVDDQLYQALRGNPKRSNLIPMPGEVDFISAGSPCQGFSALNSTKNNDKGLKNQSLVASVAAYIDFYRPKYGLLENVMTMAQKGLGRDEDVLSQLICAIVGMGYQLQLFVLDAWSLGSAQSRSRLFVSFAAPGCPTLEHPELSHAHPAHTTSRGLGKLANGESFGHRIHCPTPFDYVTASDGTGDLPDIGDGQTFQCIPYPDHVMSIKPSKDLRSQMAIIPTFPRGTSFVSALDEGRGVMTEEQRALFPSLTSSGKTRQCVQKSSKAWGRVHPRRLFPTIVVSVYPMDARMGTCLHWDQQRMITVMEARRAQSFPDHEVLVGSGPEKWKVIGNSVSRTVSLALGLSLRNAWLRSSSGDDPRAVQTTVRAILPSTQSIIREKARFVPPSKPQQEISIPSSHSTPRESNVGRPLGPLPLPSIARISEITEAITAPSNRQDQKDPGTQSRVVLKETRVLPPANPFRRRHSTMQTRIVPPERIYKAPKQYSTAPSMSTPSTDSARGGSTIVNKPRGLTVSGLHKRLNAVLKQRMVQRGKSSEDDGLHDHDSESESMEDSNDQDDEDDQDDDIALLDSVVHKLEKRFKARIATAENARSGKVLNKEGLKRRFVIDVDSSTEGNSSSTSRGTEQLRILPPPPKYIRTTNGKFATKV